MMKGDHPLWPVEDSPFPVDRFSFPLGDLQDTASVSVHLGVEASLRQPETRTNDIVSGTMLFCFVLMLIIIRRDRKNIPRRFKDFFIPKNNRRSMTAADVSEERVLRIMLAAQLVLLSSLLFYFFADKQWHPYLPGWSSIVLAPVYALTILAYLMCKSALYGQVHGVFFTRDEQEQWKEATTFLPMAANFVLFPLTLTTIYADGSLQIVTYCGLLLIVLVKILLLFKLHSIFFKKMSGVLHFILYLCTLEIAPLLVLWAALVTITKSFTTIYY